MAFQEVNTDGGTKFKFEKDKPGTALEGFYLGDDTINIKGKEVVRHTFQVGEENVSTLGAHQLDEILGKVTPGQYVRLTYKGLKPTAKGNTVKTFKLEIDPDKTIAVAQAARPPVNTTQNAIDAMKRGE